MCVFMSSTSLYLSSRDLTENFFSHYFDRLDNAYTGFTRSTAVIRFGSSVVGQMTIASRLGAVRASSHIFFKTMNWVTEGLADDEHGLILIVGTSSLKPLMSRWFQPSKESPSTRKMYLDWYHPSGTHTTLSFKIKIRNLKSKFII